MVRDLVELLQEAKQDIPKWLESFAAEHRSVSCAPPILGCYCVINFKTCDDMVDI